MKFEVSISGYGESGAMPVTLQCFHDTQENVLVILEEVPFAEARTPGFAMITNLPLQTRDFLFTDEHLRDGIRDYFARDAQGIIDIDARLVRFRPDAKIENDGIDERGPKYRLQPDISNGHVAILAAVAFVSAQAPINDAIEAVDEFTKLYTAIEI
ncbi:hypothetical protein [Stutzerimonas nitrititolerans]|uniref:hypothetical protein n=1 Tax=Stutzerimonas nitrititolerans TaxID=2482751 RepID=UPI0028B0A55B|nr:hypothetical protein [Stutzerimonas nitrititolerans]